MLLATMVAVMLICIPFAPDCATASREEPGNGERIAVLKDDALAGLDMGFVNSLTKELGQNGFSVTTLSAEHATDPSVLSPDRFSIYVVPPAEEFPVSAQRALEDYVSGSGHLCVVGNLPERKLVGLIDGRWQSPGDYISKIQPERILYNFDERDDTPDWRRGTNDKSIPAGLEIDDGGATDDGKCLKVWTENLTGWNTYYSRNRTDLFADGHKLFTFWARGDARTDGVLVEIDEKDGSRWMAVVPLTREWTYHVLTPQDFSYWSSSPTGKKRGGSEDHLRPENAVTINFGLAQSHQPNLPEGPHTFWIDKVGTAPSPPANLRDTPRELPTMEALYPNHKLYPLKDIAAVKSGPNRAVVSLPERCPVPSAGYSPVARTQAQGIGNDRRWRWIPLADAVDSSVRTRGNPLWMLVNLSGDYAGSVFAGCGYTGNEPDTAARLTEVVVRMAERVRHGLFLAEAGSDNFSYWPGETAEVGARVVNLGKDDRTAEVRVAVFAAERGSEAFSYNIGISLEPGESTTVAREWKTRDLAGAPYRVQVELVSGGRTIDRMTHEVGRLRTEKPDDSHFVKVRGNDFYLEGEKWYPVGINYWPLYVAGMRPEDYWAGWLEPRFYDPALVEKDLQRMEELGMNMVSIQLGDESCIRNALDFLRRCERHGIKVMGFLNGATPHNFRRGKVASYLEASRMKINPTLFAYDIIWEPGNWMFKEGRRDAWDGEWHKWLVERYGSVEKAEKHWNFSVPRKEGRITSPSKRQMRQDGPWRVMVAAYRRFMDDLMSRYWNRAATAIREMDPNHLVCNRQGNILPQDFTLTATAKHVDFFCPEGYAIPAGEEGYDASGFFTRYIHFVTRGKPILWLEFGKSVVGRTDRYFYPDREDLERQAEYIEQYYRMVLEAGANGVAPWWWPGGYRVKEQSDYGIINPDGTPRPAGELMGEYSDRIRMPREYPEPESWITVDRDAHPGGYWHITFNEGAEAYRKAHEQGKNLGVRTEGTGTTSVTCPRVAVGGTAYDGYEPPRYLDAEFNYLEIRDKGGAWVAAHDGADISVSAGEPVRARASIGNLQEATWVAPDDGSAEEGQVYLAATASSDVNLMQPIPKEVPYLEDAIFGEFTLCSAPREKSNVELRMTARGWAWFGEKRSFMLTPE